MRILLRLIPHGLIITIIVFVMAGSMHVLPETYHFEGAGGG